MDGQSPWTEHEVRDGDVVARPTHAHASARTRSRSRVRASHQWARPSPRAHRLPTVARTTTMLRLGRACGSARPTSYPPRTAATTTGPEAMQVRTVTLSAQAHRSPRARGCTTIAHGSRCVRSGASPLLRTSRPCTDADYAAGGPGHPFYGAPPYGMNPQQQAMFAQQQQMMMAYGGPGMGPYGGAPGQFVAPPGAFGGGAYGEDDPSGGRGHAPITLGWTVRSRAGSTRACPVSVCGNELANRRSHARCVYPAPRL